MGTWAAPFFRLLARGKRLRGTPFDPFGRTRLRRLERALPGRYLAALEEALDGLTPERLDAAIALAALPDEVRGYEGLKLERIARFEEKLAAALRALD